MNSTLLANKQENTVAYKKIQLSSMLIPANEYNMMPCPNINQNLHIMVSQINLDGGGLFIFKHRFFHRKEFTILVYSLWGDYHIFSRVLIM